MDLIASCIVNPYKRWMTTPDRPVLGILLMLGFCVLAPMGDSIAKILGSTIPLIQLLAVRFALQALVLLPIVFWNDLSLVLSPRAFRLTAIRTVLHVVGVGAMFLSLRYLPLADAVAIAFVMPFIMLLLGKFVLDEEVGGRRILACIVGFMGTLLVIQPSFSAVGLPALLPLIVAVVFALFMLVTRQLAKEVDPITLQTVSGMMASAGFAIVFGIAFYLGEASTLWVVPTGNETLLLFTIGIVGTLAHLVMTWSLRFAPSATLAPMQYLEIPVATVIGFLVFEDFPNGMAAIGIVITILAGLYVIYREHATSKEVLKQASTAG